jgi:hypothetical protein
MFKLPHVRSDPAEIVGNGDADAQDETQHSAAPVAGLLLRDGAKVPRD